jgi:hypothetical protein
MEENNEEYIENERKMKKLKEGKVRGKREQTDT